jgi:hypothetical protein
MLFQHKTKQNKKINIINFINILIYFINDNNNQSQHRDLLIQILLQNMQISD